jgi:hypothetical protein
MDGAFHNTGAQLTGQCWVGVAAGLAIRSKRANWHGRPLALERGHRVCRAECARARTSLSAERFSLSIRYGGVGSNLLAAV